MGARTLAALAGVIALVGCAPGTGAGPSAGGSPAGGSPARPTVGPSATGPSIDPSAGRQLRHKIAAETVQLVLVPFERGDDMALVLANGSGIAELKCSERAEPQICSEALKSISKLWRASKDGWNTGETVWVGHRGRPDQPAVPLLLRHPLGGKIDFVAVLNPDRSRTSGSNRASPSPSPAPSASPTSTSTATASPTGSGEEPGIGWTSGYTSEAFVNGDPAGEGQAGEASCDPFSTIERYTDIEEIPDSDHPAEPAQFTILLRLSGERMETQCAW